MKNEFECAMIGTKKKKGDLSYVEQIKISDALHFLHKAVPGSAGRRGGVRAAGDPMVLWGIRGNALDSRLSAGDDLHVGSSGGGDTPLPAQASAEYPQEHGL